MESALSNDALVSTIEYEISKIEKNLKGTDDNLRRLTGRDFYEPRTIKRDRIPPMRDDVPRHKTKDQRLGVFARLGAPVIGNARERPGRKETEDRRRVVEVANEFEPPRKKPALSSSVSRPVNDGRSRNEAVAEQTKDRASVQRNRRMLSSLLGTLNAFKTDEAKLKDKEEKRAAIDKKLEEKSQAQKEELRKEKAELFNQRKEQKALIRNLTQKKIRVKEHEALEAHQRQLANFIRTKAKPHVFWYPKKVTSETTSMVADTKKIIERELAEERLKMKEEFDDAFGAMKENSPKGETERNNNRDQEELSAGEGGDFDEMNSADILDYEESGELDYEELTTGKQTERVVVQVGRDVDSGESRKVELVSVVNDDASKKGKHDDISKAEPSQKIEKLKTEATPITKGVNGKSKSESGDSETSTDSDDDSSSDSNSSSTSSSSSSSSSGSDRMSDVKKKRLAIRKSVEEKRRRKQSSSSEEESSKKRPTSRSSRKSSPKTTDRKSSRRGDRR